MKGGWAFLRELSSCVFGIYLLHALVLELLRQDYFGFQFSQRSFAPVLGIPLYALAAFWLSFPVIFLLHKVPLVRNVVP
jgi:surface polysaccharide O-acyltransferase-like enzyme